MKTVKSAVAAFALFTLSFGTFAAQPVSTDQAMHMTKIGVVAVDGASTLDSLEAKLAAKADAAGAKGYMITSASTRDKMSGTAVIYQ